MNERDAFDSLLGGIGHVSRINPVMNVATGAVCAIFVSLLLPMWVFLVPMMFVGEWLFGHQAATENWWLIAGEFLTADALGALALLPLTR